jgi:hypothetical protein
VYAWELQTSLSIGDKTCRCRLRACKAKYQLSWSLKTYGS